MDALRPTRRTFLGTAAAALAWPSIGRTAPAPQTRGSGRTLKIGIASYSLREFPLEQALAMARQMSIGYMTFKDVHLPRTDPPDVLAAKRRQIEGAGITIMGGGTITMDNDPEQIRRDFQYAKLAGFPLIYASPDPAALDFIEQMVREHDLRLAIHNHGPEDKWYPAPRDAYVRIANRDRRLGLCIDIGHTARTGTDFVQSVLEYQDRLYDLHVKDLKDSMDKDSQVEVGRGALDIPRLFQALLQINYEGQVGLEYEINAKNPGPGMQESIAYMRGVLAGLTT